ncbi:hypothetical protein E2P81_ATG09626 [Venturia nashicola]|uniref:Uncharacterized protein n=1 Tax=Venturia nashicola TaxID=86259 RepID=A0A4Z1NQW6_9PEZI|nr:hypothetical protein E6O75_ATG09837 [Venturia nashicola]TLD25969.1 hypothetical protein E2P81_ATG09626 [Venturia nashicola]
MIGFNEMPKLTLDMSPPMFGAASFRMIDLQLMNHYTFMHMVGTNLQPDPRVRQMWVYDVPQRAVGCEFLMQAVLSFAALHLHIHKPHDNRIKLLSHHYFGSALRMLMLQLSRIGPQNADMAFAASVMIQFQVFMSWKDPCCQGLTVYKPPIQWLEMCQGVNSILKSALSNVQSSCMKPLLEASPNTISSAAVGPTAPTSPASPASPSSPELYEEGFQLWGSFLREDISDEGVSLKRSFNLIHNLYLAHISGESRSVSRRRLLTFPNALDATFVALLRESDPRAMITLSYYFAIMKLSEDIWWFHGRPEFEINGVWSVLGDDWKMYMAWPREMIAGAVDIPVGAPSCDGSHKLPEEAKLPQPGTSKILEEAIT